MLKLVNASPPTLVGGPRPTQLDVVLTVLHVLVPAAERDRTEPLWNHVREDLFDGATALRLRRNGLRVGLGTSQWWDAVRATLDAVDGVQSISLAPVRLPPNYPLAWSLIPGRASRRSFSWATTVC